MSIKAPAIRVLQARLQQRAEANYKLYGEPAEGDLKAWVERRKAIDEAATAALAKEFNKRPKKYAVIAPAYGYYGDCSVLATPEWRAKHKEICALFDAQRKADPDPRSSYEIVYFVALNFSVTIWGAKNIPEWKKLATDIDSAFLEGEALGLVDLIEAALG